MARPAPGTSGGIFHKKIVHLVTAVTEGGDKSCHLSLGNNRPKHDSAGGTEGNTAMTIWKAFAVALPLVLASAALMLPVEFWGAPGVGGISAVSGTSANPMM